MINFGRTIPVLPFLGWGLFGFGAADGTPKIAIATLILYLIYSAGLGWGSVRSFTKGQEGSEA